MNSRPRPGKGEAGCQAARAYDARVILSAEAEQKEEDRITASLAGLALALFLVVVGLFLINHLREKARIEDCLMSGRLNCDQLLVQQ